MKSKAVLAVAALVAATVSVPAFAAPRPASPYDFNGDGKNDLVVGAPIEDLSEESPSPGVVTVLYGKKVQRITRTSPGLTKLRLGRGFGKSMASADFDRDGYADLAIGDEADGLAIVYGSKKGLGGRVAKRVLPKNGHFMLVTGDFSGDGRPDLVAAVQTGYRIFPNGGRAWQDRRLSADDLYGAAAGDYTGDGKDDLIALRAMASDGKSYLLKGTPSGPGAPVLLPMVGAWNGHSGDFNGDGRDDFVGSTDGESTINVMLGGSNGLVRPTRFGQGTPGVPGAAGGVFGHALSTGDINKDGYDDFVVSDYEERVAKKHSGMVIIMFGSKKGLTTRGIKIITKATKGVPGAPDDGDGFGNSLQLIDLTGDQRPELVVGSNRHLYVFANRRGHISTTGIKIRNSLGSMLLP
jgi:hypothetical protein